MDADVEAGTGVYRPPKLQPTSMPGEVESQGLEKQKAKERRRLRVRDDVVRRVVTQSNVGRLSRVWNRLD